jgi:hypothetical protein
MIQATVREMGRNGWEPTQPTDLGYLWTSGNIQFKWVGWASHNKARFESVTLQFRRDAH